MDLIVVDDFLPTASAARDQALSSEWINWLGYDNEVYKRVQIVEIPGLQAAIEKELDRPVKMLGMGFRLNYEKELPNSLVHSDFGWGTHALVLYLSEGPSGTAFFRHRQTHTDRVKIGDSHQAIVTRDWNNKDAWELFKFVSMKFNRALIYRSELYHARYPFTAFGNTPENGRLIAVAFFTPKDELMIRKAVEADLRAVVEMSSKFYKHTHYSKLVSMNDVSVGALSMMLIEQGSLFVAEIGGEVKGMLGFVCTPFMFNPQLVGAHEVVWYVEEEARTAGLGPKLLLYAEKELKAAGVNFIQMADLPENTSGAGELYQRLGYSTSEYSYTKVI